MSMPVPHRTSSLHSRPSAQSDSRPALSEDDQPKPEAEKLPPVSELKVYSHSSLIYWWPVWAVGYLMAFLTYSFGHKYQIGQDAEWIHSSSNLDGAGKTS